MKKNFNAIINLHFSKILLVEHNVKISAKLLSAVKNKISMNKWLNFEFPYFSNTLCTFWLNSTLFQGLENRFHNSILFQYFQYRVKTLILFFQLGFFRITHLNK